MSVEPTRRSLRAVASVAMVAVAILVGAAGAQLQPAGAVDGPAQQAARNQLKIRQVHTPQGDRTLPSLSAGVVDSARAAFVAATRGSARPGAATNQAPGAGAATAVPAPAVTGDELGTARQTLGCSRRNGGTAPVDATNVRVNQDCGYRRQAEELIKFNPIQPDNLIAGQNDSRLGFNKCGFDYSFDAGVSWGDGTPPFGEKLNEPNQDTAGIDGDPNQNTIFNNAGTEHTYDAFSDPALAFDSAGRAFYGCVGFDVNDSASGFLVSASPPGAGGSFYNTVAPFGRAYVVVEDNNPYVFHDKPFIAADSFASSPNRDNVYATWTVFKVDETNCPLNAVASVVCSPIFGSMSTDHGLTWSTPQEISGSSTALCGGACNQDQGSDPIVLPDGRVAVVFHNADSGSASPNPQNLAVSCRPTGKSSDGTANFNCAPPALVGPDIAVDEPKCDFGRGPEECIPGAFIRANDYPRIAVNRDNGHLYATWNDYRNHRFDIQLAASSDGGATWTAASAPVNADLSQDHYFPAVDVAASPQGNTPPPDPSTPDHVGVSYFRTARVRDEYPLRQVSALGQPGVGKKPSDYLLAGGRGLSTPYKFTVVSHDFPPPDGTQATFNGDYSGLVVINAGAHPIWSDTRNAVPASADPQMQGVTRDEDIFTLGLALPG